MPPPDLATLRKFVLAIALLVPSIQLSPTELNAAHHEALATSPKFAPELVALVQLMVISLLLLFVVLLSVIAILLRSVPELVLSVHRMAGRRSKLFAANPLVLAIPPRNVLESPASAPTTTSILLLMPVVPLAEIVTSRNTVPETVVIVRLIATSHLLLFAELPLVFAT